ncbi:Uma2 family endonuclease [Anatilimnocola sp. NA78]|uniref:Uma2 family endonuclease n=1 Tax=Anatilimnocola sp. NA78 TaxID=3415683 RepID=UPI003CE5A6AF
MSTVIPPNRLPSVIPPLEPGDCLSRDEFERRYEAMPHLKKAELIEGVVYTPAAVRAFNHGRPQQVIATLLGTYDSATPGTLSFDNTSVRLDLDNMPQPDQVLLILPECGGQSKLSNDDYIEQAPELACEISSSSVSFDLHTKLQVYRRSGVREYLVWRVRDQQIDWFSLLGNDYVKMSPDAAGLLKSQVFPGLWLRPAELIKFAMKKALRTLDQGLASAEHAAFVKQLNFPAEE